MRRLHDVSDAGAQNGHIDWRDQLGIARRLQPPAHGSESSRVAAVDGIDQVVRYTEIGSRSLQEEHVI